MATKKTTYPENWVASKKELENGWSNAPKILSEITTYLNENGWYVEDESEFMEAVDIMLEFFKVKYIIKEKKPVG